MDAVYKDPMWQFKIDPLFLCGEFSDEDLYYHKPVMVKLEAEEDEDERGVYRRIIHHEVIDESQYTPSELKEIEKWAYSDEGIKFAFHMTDIMKR